MKMIFLGATLITSILIGARSAAAAGRRAVSPAAPRDGG
jgi:hypothetical protein